MIDGSKEEVVNSLDPTLYVGTQRLFSSAKIQFNWLSRMFSSSHSDSDEVVELPMLNPFWYCAPHKVAWRENAVPVRAHNLGDAIGT